ncbi:AraC family transcriptional regulator [Prolixibacteraceae bacterium JC049]|nr:AraC family transcriptional regulator [Prolixibacteraceae bacterium JC049]
MINKLMGYQVDYIHLLPDMEALLYIVLSQSIFAGLMIWSLKRKHLANWILVAWLLTIGFAMILDLIKLNDPALRDSAVGVAIFFTFGPFLLLYSEAAMQKEPRFRPKMLLHFIPYTFFLVLFSFYRLEPVFANKDLFAPGDYFFVRVLFTVAALISIVAYVLVVLIRLKKHNQNLRNEYSYISDFVTLGWLKLLAFWFSLSYGIIIFFGAVPFFHEDLTSYIFIIMNMVFAYLVSFLGFRQPIIFDPNRSVIVNRYLKERFNFEEEVREQEEKIEEKSAASKYEKSGLRDDMASEYLDKILNFMQIKKPFLQGDLTLQEMADQLEISKHHLTQVINERLHKNFYQFINEYRIEEVKRRMILPENDNITILGIAYDCGFNSKSAFNKIFKQVVGTTPSQYKKSLTDNE